jgi:hypothetical protein
MANQNAAVPPVVAAPPIQVVPPGVGLAPPVFPDIPFGGEPGSLSHWIISETIDATSADITNYINEVQRRYTAIPDPVADPDAHEDGIQGLVEDVLGSVEFAGFLQVSSLGRQQFRKIQCGFGSIPRS